MSLKALITTSRSAGLLPYIGGALVIVALLSAVGGGWAGYRWEKGAHAIAESKALKQEVKDWQDIAQTQRQNNVDADLAMRAAIGRMDSIALNREKDRAQIQQFFDAQSKALAQLLRDRPDLRTQLGDDVLCHINQAKAAAAGEASATVAIPGCQPPAKVPATAVPHRQQQGGDHRGQRHDGADVRGVPQQQQPPGGRGPGMAEDRVAVVLRLARSPGDQGGRLRGEVNER